MKEIYDEQNKNGKFRSRSKNSKGQDYSSSESIENINNNLTRSNNQNLNSGLKSSILNLTRNKDYSGLCINEVCLSHKKPNFQNKIFAKYQNCDSSKILQ